MGVARQTSKIARCRHRHCLHSDVTSDPECRYTNDVCVAPLIRMRVESGSGDCIDPEDDPEVGGVVLVDLTHAEGHPGFGGEGSREVDVDPVSSRLGAVGSDDVGLRVRGESYHT